MLAAVEVMPAAEFDAWLEERLRSSRQARRRSAQELWDGACAKCHGLGGEGGYGPTHRRERARSRTRSRVETLLRNGRHQMPPVGRGLERRRDDALITSYLKERPLAVRAEQPPVPAWQRGRVASWLATVDHKRIGILYIVTASSSS